MFKTLDAVGGSLQIIGAFTPVLGAIVAIVASMGTQNSLASILLYVCGGLMLGAVLYAFGGSVRAVVMISRNSQRSANALNRIAQAQTGAAEFIPDQKQKTGGIKPLK